MASAGGAPKVCSLRTIKSDVVVGLSSGVGERLDEEEPGWKISGKYVSRSSMSTPSCSNDHPVQAVVLVSEGNPGEKVRFA